MLVSPSTGPKITGLRMTGLPPQQSPTEPTGDGLGSLIGWFVDVEQRGGLRAPTLETQPLTSRQRALKRALDVVGASLLLMLSLPVCASAMLAVRLSSRGGIMFRQVRTGLNRRRQDRRRSNAGPPDGSDDRRSRAMDRRLRQDFGQPFVLYKLRTMTQDAEANGPQLATAGDPRVTPVGRFLRRTRMDEIPQLWNVIKGDMSLIGPRPERPEFIRELSGEIPGYLARLGIKPGLTGLAQVVNGYDDSMDSFRRKVSLDLLYVENYSFWLDLRILVATVLVVLTGRGARCARPGRGARRAPRIRTALAGRPRRKPPLRHHPYAVVGPSPRRAPQRGRPANASWPSLLHARHRPCSPVWRCTAHRTSNAGASRRVLECPGSGGTRDGSDGGVAGAGVGGGIRLRWLSDGLCAEPRTAVFARRGLRVYSRRHARERSGSAARRCR